MLRLIKTVALPPFKSLLLGSSIRDFSDLQLDDVIEVEVQPGDFNLLTEKTFLKAGFSLVLAQRTERYFFA